MNILKKTYHASLHWGAGFATALIPALLFLAVSPPKETIKTVEVPVIKTIKTPIIIYKQVYLHTKANKQIQCLAENIYFEAGNQSTKGKIAVAHVVMNRVKDPRFPNTICKVIHQKTKIGCQFSWVCGNARIINNAVFMKSHYIAEQVYIGNTKDATHGAKYYHANYVRPNWPMKQVARIGAHIFYID